MLRRFVMIILVISLAMMLPEYVMSQDMTTDEIIKELRALKQRIHKLEEALSKKDQEIERLKAQTVKREEMADVIEDMKSEGRPLAGLQDHIQLSGLIEVGGAWENVDNRDGTDESQSDLNLTTVELTVAAEVNDWVNAETTLLFEDNTFAPDEDFNVDVATVTMGNTEKLPLYLTAGKMYVPFGALLTHFADDPLVDQPITLSFGEISEKAVLIGFEHNGFSLSGYLFNGELNEAGDDHIESFGFDANYAFTNDRGFELLVGASYISNVADSDGLTDSLGLLSIKDYVGGFGAYLHFGFSNCFFDAEYMTATEDFEPTELAMRNGLGAQPSVWNLEAGYNWDWGKNLEIAFKYAGSDETENLGLPEDRYGLALNQTIFEGVIGSVAFLYDKFDENDQDRRDDRNVVFGQIAVEF